MSKPFITYTAQVEKLKNEKDLVITDDDFAVESLQNISYYLNSRNGYIESYM